LAFGQNLKIIPVINKIDLPSANLELCTRQLEDILTIPAEEAILASGKSGIGIVDILEAVVARVPSPRWTDYPQARILVFDSLYDAYRGCIAYVRVFSGSIKAHDMMMLMSTGQKAEVKDAKETKDTKDTTPKPKLAPGSEQSSAIILLTDGQATSGPDPIKAAQLAADRGVRLFTIGLGTDAGAVVKVEGVSMRVQLDVETLKKIADITLGRTFLAADSKDLSSVYRNLNTRLVTEIKETEITAAFIALAALAAMVGATLSFIWFNRVL
jgi:translation elongation factor EF-G